MRKPTPRSLPRSAAFRRNGARRRPYPMLREMHKVQQVAGEAHRRWFQDHEMDLVVWQDEDGGLLGFQLAYDRHRNEHSIEWRAGRGFTHYQVDDGEAAALSKETPFLYLDGAFERDRVLADFLVAAATLPPAIAGFVAARLREFKGGQR